MKGLSIDKEIGDVAYNDEFHKYWSKSEGIVFTSVTTIIGLYHDKFDKAYWLPYKALQSIIPSDVWNRAYRTYKKDKNGKSKAFIKAMTKLVSGEAFKAACEAIDAQWNTTNKVACERGHGVHKFKEDSYMKEPTHLIDGKAYRLGIDHKLDLEDGIYPELLMCDTEYRLAGQADRVIKEGLYVDIHDYKTNKTIEKESFLNKSTGLRRMMHKPIAHLMDCTLIHYYLQLSLYAWILERQGLVPRKLTIEHIDHGGNVTFYDVPYLKAEIDKMMSHYRKHKMNR
jgi:hypothetical protein